MDTHGSIWKSPKTILGTTDAVQIGYLYFIMAFLNAGFSGLYALLIRLELWTPEASYFNNGVEYSSAFTLHGTVMVFLVIVPLGAGMGNYLIPRMVAAINADMYWPKWNNVAFWMLPIGSIFVWISQAPIGWTAYAPLSVTTGEPGIDLWIFGLIISGISSTIGSINFILTIWKGRDPKLGWMDLDLFVWGTLITSILLLLTTPSIVLAIVMIFFDRNLSTAFFFNPAAGGPTAPIMYQHLFWFFSHPEVYVMVMPAFGLISLLIGKFARTKIFGYQGMVAAFIGIGVLSFLVWAHHMYTTGINPLVRVAFTTMTFVISIPSGIKVFNWITTLYAGRIKFEVPMLFSLSFIIMFTLGGITGVFVNIVPIDITLHDTYWVVGHFHFVVAAGTLQAFFGAIYYYFPDMTGKYYHKLTASLHFWFWSLGNLTTFIAFTLLGMEGMPRRYFTYPEQFQGLHQFATVGAVLMGASFAFFVISIFIGYFKGDKVEDFSNLFGLGSGYDFPEPYADRIKRETGEEIKIEHSLSLWSSSFGFVISLPFFAFLGLAETGFFDARGIELLNSAGDINGAVLVSLLFMVGFSILWLTTLRDVKKDERLPVFFTVGVLILEALIIFGVFTDRSFRDSWGWIGLLLMSLFVFWVAAFFNAESKEEKGPALLDGMKKGRNWEIWTFLSSETIFFGILIGVGLAMKGQHPEEFAEGVSHLAIFLTAINTFILIVSSFTMAKAVEAIKKGQSEKLVEYLRYTILFGTIFISVQIFEYYELIHEGLIAIGTQSGELPIYSSAFFIQTGFHGAHVLIGIVLLVFIFLRARQGGYSEKNHEYVEFVGLYWHFVDLVWIVLFTIVYLL